MKNKHNSPVWVFAGFQSGTISMPTIMTENFESIADRKIQNQKNITIYIKRIRKIHTMEKLAFPMLYTEADLYVPVAKWRPSLLRQQSNLSKMKSPLYSSDSCRIHTVISRFLVK